MASTNVSVEQLAEADVKFKRALELRDSDVETAVDLLGQVLETRNKAYGENAPECADTYLYYGQLLFEQAQAASDFFGDQMKSAANQRAKAIAAAEADAAEAEDGNADGDKEQPETPATDAATTDQEAKTTETTASDDKKADEAPAAPAEGTEAAEPQAADTTAPSPAADEPTKQPTDTTETPAEADSSKAAEAADGAAPDAAGNAEKGEDKGEGEEGSDGEEDEEEESGSSGDDGEGEAAAGEEGTGGEGKSTEGVEVTGESDDMALAWEMLELAHLIYNNNGGADTHANKLADCHLYIGDILAEQEKFEAAVEEYKTAQDMLAKLEGGHNAHKRRAAELEFKKAATLQLLDAPAEALTAMQAAKGHLTAHLEAVNADIAKAGSSGTDVSGAVASAAFASILSGYASTTTTVAATAGAADGEQKQQGDEAGGADAARVAKLHKEASELKSTIESVNDRIEELSAAVQEHISMKEQLANLFKAVAAEGGSSKQGGAAAAGSSGVESIGFGAAGSSKPAGEVKDIGVIGKGRRVAPTPVEPSAAAAPAAPAAKEPTAAAAAGDKPAEASKAPSDQAPPAAAPAEPAAEPAAAPAAEPAAAPAAGGESVVGKKRPLSDLTSSDQEPGAEDASADAAVAKVAAAAAAQAVDQPDAAPKRARV